METALITGASTGLGREFAKIFAREKYNLVVVARDKERLELLAEQLRAERQIDVLVIAADLADCRSAQLVYNQVCEHGLTVGVLVNNAGSGYHGLFAESDPSGAEEVINLNVTSQTLLTQLFLKDMLERRCGKILNVSSVCAFQPNPLFAVYGATKAYQLLFTESLAAELEGSGVTASVLCPGPTKTEFACRSGRNDASFAMDAGRVALAGYRGLMSGRLVIIPGIGNRLGKSLIRLLPAKTASRMIKKWQEGLKK